MLALPGRPHVHDPTASCGFLFTNEDVKRLAELPRAQLVMSRPFGSCAVLFTYDARNKMHCIVLQSYILDYSNALTLVGATR